ncbi:somatomedin-B and thrombospondin type-1 domain-containing protein-like isoform X2 [Arapaima gigas]
MGAKAGTLICGLVLLLPGTLFLHAEAGCGARGNPRCCGGRNNECSAMSGHRTVCYCDTYCRKTGDCCEDYARVCHASAIDCVLGSWGLWAQCSSPCGAGSKERTRQVIVPPRNGGAPCPDLKQRRGCFGDGPLCRSAKEVARLLPDSFRRNFKDPWRRPHMFRKEQKPSCCVWLRVKHSSTVCRLHTWTAQLSREQLVCAECQSDAMNSDDRCTGDGQEGVTTFWAAELVPGCHGTWKRELFSCSCQCPLRSVLFV